MVCRVITLTMLLLFLTWQNDSESCGLFYEQYAEKIKTEDEPDIMEDFKLAATEGRIGGKSQRKSRLTVLKIHGYLCRIEMPHC